MYLSGRIRKRLPFVPSLDRVLNGEYREALRKIANCQGCSGCRDVARTALGVAHSEFVYHADIHADPPAEGTGAHV